jgi:ABC-type nitrate/sulfonate/bicarbonate transport system substrate-binding protein
MTMEPERRPPAAPRGARLGRRALLQRALFGAVGASPLLAGLSAACQPAGSPTASAPAAPSGGPGAAGAATATSTAPGVALARPQKAKIAWTAVTGAQSAVWMAFETGAWQELGLDVELLRIGSSSRMAASMQAGEIDGGVLDWALAFQFIAQGGNAKQVGSITNKLIFAVEAQPSITQPRDVVGKRWGITRLGSSTHTATLVALETWGLRADDVQLIQLQEVPAILTGLEAQQIDVGTMSPPTSTRARELGMRELLDLAEAGPDYPSIGLALLDRHVRENPDLVRAYVAGYAVGVARFRKDRARALEVLRKYLQIDDETILADTHERFSRYLAYPPTVPMASLQRVKDDVVRDDPSVANVAIADVAAPQIADELEAQGFFSGLL